MSKKNKSSRYRLSKEEERLLMSYREENKESRVLVIGDTHCPFDLDTYLDFLVDTYNKYNCCLLYTCPIPRDGLLSRMPSSA